MSVKNINRELVLMLLACAIALALAVMHVAMPAHAQTPTSSSAHMRVLQSDVNRVVLEFSAPTYNTQPRTIGGANYLALTIPGLSVTGEPGKPQLPVDGGMIGIPPGAVAALKIVADDAVRVKLNAPPLPVPTLRVEFDPTRTLPSQPRYESVPDAVAYAANRLYPADAARIGADGKWRSQRYLTVQFYPLQYNGATRELVFHRRLRVEIAFTYPRGQTRDALGGTVNEGAFEAALKTMLLNYDSAKAWRVRTAVPTTKPRQSRSADEWYKITVGGDGIYKLTCAQLNVAGAPSNLNPNTIRMYKNAYGVGPELKIYQAWQNGDSCDDNHYILFWAQGINTKYSNKNVYWLTYGGVNGARMSERSGDAVGASPEPYTHTIRLEQDRLYRPYLPMIEDTDHWYWNSVGQNTPPYFCNPCDYTFQADQVVAGGYTATLTLNLMGFMVGGQLDHRTVVSMNNNLIADVAWTGQVVFSTTIPFTQTYLNEGTNTLRVYETYSNILTNSFDVSYLHEFQAVSDALRFRQAAAGTWQYQIGNFTTANLQAFDITNLYDVARIISPTITGGPPYTYRFTDTVPDVREYIVLAPAQFKSPVSVTRDTFANLASTTNGADYIIIAYGAFITNVQPLANLRTAQGLRVKIVDVQDVYDEFNDGVLHPQAIRNFLAYAYTSWQSPAPSFVLLVGDGTFDVKENCTTAGYCQGITTSPNSTFIPPFLRMVDPWNGETASDNYFVAFNSGSGDMLPQMAIGRLPVNSAAETSDVVAKLLAYEQSTPAGIWRSTVAFVADNPDPSAGDFWDLSNQIADDPQYFPTSLRADKLYYGQTYTDPAAMHSAVIAAMNSGRLIVNYIGHGSFQYWAGEQFFTNADVATLTNGTKLPVMLEMTCYTGYFHYPNFPSLAEVNVRRAGNGALASWAATGLGVAQGHDALNKGFFEAVMQQGVRRIGLAADAGKAKLQSTGQHLDLIDTYILFGDPASLLQIQFLHYLYLPLIRK